MCSSSHRESSRRVERRRRARGVENAESIKYAARGCEDTLIKTGGRPQNSLLALSLSLAARDVYTKGRSVRNAEKAKVKAAPFPTSSETSFRSIRRSFILSLFFFRFFFFGDLRASLVATPCLTTSLFRLYLWHRLMFRTVYGFFIALKNSLKNVSITLGEKPCSKDAWFFFLLSFRFFFLLRWSSFLYRCHLPPHYLTFSSLFVTPSCVSHGLWGFFYWSKKYLWEMSRLPLKKNRARRMNDFFFFFLFCIHGKTSEEWGFHFQTRKLNIVYSALVLLGSPPSTVLFLSVASRKSVNGGEGFAPLEYEMYRSSILFVTLVDVYYRALLHFLFFIHVL